MPTSLKAIDKELKILLRPEQFSDYCPNGLQLEGVAQVTKVVSGVTASMALIEAAAEQQAQLLLVHHGYFWRGENQTITGIKKNRVEALLRHGLSLIAYHLPLDVHAQFGNNVQLARLLDFEINGELGKQNNHPIGLIGNTAEAMQFTQFNDFIAAKLGRQPLGIKGDDREIHTVAWCTGAAQNYIELAVEAGVDAYISGEISEPTVHIARETGMHYFSAGHHATERYGVQALGQYLAAKFGLEHSFVDIENPV